MNKEERCPDFPFWGGAIYPNARCISGKLYDLDKCDKNGLHEPIDDIPCPFCNTEEFIEVDHFGKVDAFLDELMEDDSPEQYDVHIDEAKEKAREWYLIWIENLKDKYHLDRFIVKIDENAYLTDGEGDPPRTVLKENAKVFNNKDEAALAAAEAMKTHPYRKVNYTFEKIYG